MSEERVDKTWQKHGLGKYSVGAILGTLRHYGVQVDEAGFQALSEERYPLQIAEGWHVGWKGTGQFSLFHFAAADELWRRLRGDRLSPSDFGVALRDLLGAVGQRLQGKADAALGPAFQKVEELKPRVPLANGQPVPAFLLEVARRIGGEGVNLLNQVAVDLARAGHGEDALRYVEIEEFLFPQMAGVARALIRAEKGEAGAMEALVTLGQDTSRDPAARINILDGLIRLRALKPATELAGSLFDAAEKAQDFHLGLDTGERLAWLLEETNAPPAEREALEKRRQRLQEAHAVAHPRH